MSKALNQWLLVAAAGAFGSVAAEDSPRTWRRTSTRNTRDLAALAARRKANKAARKSRRRNRK